ncbi:MAG: hypothetical protein R6V77_02700 [Candidatus Cloacimonadaceae bacterium]
MKRIKFTLFLLLIACWMPARSNELKILMDSLLEKHPDYQQALSRFEQEKALYTIEKSLDWFDVNLRYQQYDNDFTRDDFDPVLEHSDVDEKDKRWRIEIEKQLFPKDFDNVTDVIGTRINLMRYRMETRLTYFTALNDIIDDFIKWYEADMMFAYLQSRLNILYQQNQTLEEMDIQNLIGPEMLIDNLEEIDKMEDNLYSFKKAASVFTNKYGNILPDFLDTFQDYINQNSRPDTLLFQQKINSEFSELKTEKKKLANKISRSYLHFFLPEVNLKLSYNWRQTKQNWDIEKNNIFKTMIRNQNEEFPEGEIEVSLPFNVFSNTSGKYSLLKAYQRELNYRSNKIMLDWQKYSISRMNAYYAASHELKRKTRLKELYERNLNLQNQKFKEEPSLLGMNPELKLMKESLKADEAAVEMKIAEMKFYKEIFLINNL